jgi:hypothetical protein
MEGLNLGDLDFDTDVLGLFDEETGNQDPKKQTAAAPAATSSNDDTTKKITDSDDPTKKGQESVVDQSKENQVQTGKTSDKKGDGSDSSSPKLNETEQLYSKLAAEFKAKGVLPGLENTDSIKSLKDIEDAIRKEINSKLTDEQKTIKEAQESGAPITLVAEKLNTINKLKQVTPEYIAEDRNLEFRKTAIAQDFMDKGYGKERAEALAQRSVDAGTDIEDAEFALANLIKSEESSLQGILDTAKSNEKESLKDIKNYISTTPEVIPGIALTDSQKDELFKQITTDLEQGKCIYAGSES